MELRGIVDRLLEERRYLPPRQVEQAVSRKVKLPPFWEKDAAAWFKLVEAILGGVLQQRCGAGWQPLAFFSRKLNTAEAKYSTLDRELMACLEAIQHFRCLVEGQAFTLYTDHKPLIYLRAKEAEVWSAWHQRHLAYVAEYTADIKHVPGVENVVADALSRPQLTC